MKKLFYVLFLIALGTGVIFVVYNRTGQRASAPQYIQPSLVPTATQEPGGLLPPQPSGESSGIFTHRIYHYSFQYPTSWVLLPEDTSNKFVMLYPKWDDDYERYFRIMIDPPKKSDLSLVDYARQQIGIRPTKQWTEKIGMNEWFFFFPENDSPLYALSAFTQVNGTIYTFIVEPHEYPNPTHDLTTDAKVNETNQVFRFVLQTFQPGG